MRNWKKALLANCLILGMFLFKFQDSTLVSAMGANMDDVDGTQISDATWSKETVTPDRTSRIQSFANMSGSQISLETYAISMNVGETRTISASYSPSNYTLRWSSGNTRVASVNQSTGRIEAKACGKIQIRVCFNENTSIYKIVTVTVNPATSQTSGITSDNIYMIKNMSNGKYLTAMGTTQLTTNTKNVMDGRQLWYVEWTGSGYRLYSLGKKDTSSNGKNETSLGGSSDNYSPRVEANNSGYNKWNINYCGGAYYLTNTSYNTSSLSCSSSSTNVLMYSLSSENNYAKWSFEKIERSSFNNYWSGNYAGQGSTLFIKISIDNSGADSVYLNSIISASNFNVINQWKNKSNHVVIYGPNDSVPSGITPVVVTYKGDVELRSNTYGYTHPNYGNSEAELSGTWQTVDIFLNTSSSGALVNAGSDTIEKVILHELGHAMKLAHPKQTTDLSLVTNGRGGYADDNSVLANMNQGDPLSQNNLTCARPKWHDIINLKNKWGN